MKPFNVNVQLASYTVRVTNRKDKYFDPSKNQGLCEPNVKRIYISNQLSNDLKFATYIHELIHAVFFELGEDGLAYNEPFVETISQILARAFRELPEGFR